MRAQILQQCFTLMQVDEVDVGSCSFLLPLLPGSLPPVEEQGCPKACWTTTAVSPAASLFEPQAIRAGPEKGIQQSKEPVCTVCGVGLLQVQGISDLFQGQVAGGQCMEKNQGSSLWIGKTGHDCWPELVVLQKQM